LLHDTQAVVAAIKEGDSWLSAATGIDEGLSETVRKQLSQAWLADALAEHASIAAFARNTLELLSLGAPAELVAGSQRAGLDEVRHAQRCFELAAAYAGSPLSPGPLPLLPARRASLERLAVDTFIEGCVGETISAMHALRATKRSPTDIAKVWGMLARDEMRHAALAWRTLTWVVAQTGVSVRDPLVAVAAQRGSELPSVDDKSDEDALPARLSSRERACIHQETWHEIILPTLSNILAFSCESGRPVSCAAKSSSDFAGGAPRMTADAVSRQP
jgi:hypothetical protein